MIFYNSLQKKIDEIERKLLEIQSLDILLETILTETRKLVNADAGSIYVPVKKDTGSFLQIIHGQNDTRQKALAPGEKLPYTWFDFPINEKTICGYVGLTKTPVSINNCYKISPDKPYKFSESTDVITGYKTVSMYTVPLLSNKGKLLGVLQIINALNGKGKPVPFSSKAKQLIDIFAQKVVIPLQDANFTEENNKRILKMAEFRDPKETYPHVERVSRISREIYERWAFNHNISEDDKLHFRDAITIAAKFHDVGKVGISDVILKKPGKFTDEERSIMKAHTCLGAVLFDNEEEKSFIDQMSYDSALHHHDRWDGGENGYPGKVNLDDFNVKDGKLPASEILKGEDIPLAARIVSVADVFDALSHKRCYKEAWTMDDTINEIKNCAGTQFDPEVVKAFEERLERILKINESFPDEED